MELKTILGADPEVIFDKKSNKYYAYMTNEASHQANFRIFESEDLNNWKEVGFALDESDPNLWGTEWFWAPECYFNPNNGYYYLFYSAKVGPKLVEEYFHDKNYEENCRIAVAISKSPRGPFRNITNKPLDFHPYDRKIKRIWEKHDDLFDKSVTKEEYDSCSEGEFVSTIDINLLFDNDKRIYMYFSRCCYRNPLWDDKNNKIVEESNICVVELDTKWWYSKEPIMPEVKEEYKCVVDGIRKDKYVDVISHVLSPQEWEDGTICDYDKGIGCHRNRRWSEGSTTLHINLDGEDCYALTYSSNYFAHELYGVGFAVAKSPLGPFVKYENNPIISKKDDKRYCSLGHGCLFDLNGTYHYVLHGRQYGDPSRSLFHVIFDKFSFKDGITIKEIIQCNEIK